ncbi:large-conductance mechanosensitive channel protein MscL [Leucobacter sp. CSA1]|uniref:Large-conductance mechanosensitive channel n=1 Tax=Leucobacter chromiisoli TaxID=2796471 RepID=A0A934UW25_9MICO|nr:large-conductance mechanosensitive channel protein MscL [Leucobacter chromiisoli]MBK0420096.1 large-conductance mechanosensitive channel protein MscL [Leucobacter chromiisoli]
MLKGFKEFLLRGNVVDLAVAVVIGAAFNSIVDRFVEALINPVIGMVFRADSLDGALQVSLPGGGTLAFGAVIGAIINFLIVAAVVYFVFVMPMNTLRERTKKEDEPETPAGETEQELLTQIRDLMREQQAQGPQTVPVQDPAQMTSADETPRGSHGAHGA